MDRSMLFANEHLDMSTSAWKQDSSSTLLDPESSTLRARLKTPRSIKQVYSGPAQVKGGDAKAYERFRACLQLDPKDLSNPREDASRPDESLKGKLQAAFAEEALRFYTSVASAIVQAHTDLDTKIDSVGAAATSLLKTCEDLYSNISYPLSATRCCADGVASDTIAAHLASMQQRLCAAQQELQEHQTAWEQCRAQEKRALTQLREMESTQQSSVSGDGEKGWRRELDFFNNEVAIIQQEFEEKLNDIEADYKESMQGETMKMMQSMMAS